MLSFLFWQKWLFYTSLLFAAFGILLAFGSDIPPLSAYRSALSQSLLNSDSMPEDAARLYRFSAGPLGGSIASSYLLLAFIAANPFKNKQRWALQAIIIAFGAWMVLDSYVALTCGVYFQVYAVNAFSAVVKILPIIFTWKEFEKKQTIRS